MAGSRVRGMQTTEIKNICDIRGVPYPCGVKFRRLIVTGPPGSGKTTLLTKLHGWPEEGYLDLSQKTWWLNRVLTYRPREVHLGLPFKGHADAYAVFDREWLESPAEPDLERIQTPSIGKWFWQRDWRNYYLFDFQLPSAEVIFETRSERKTRGTHPVDIDLTLDIVRQQIEVYKSVACHLHQQGLRVIVRNSFQGVPRYLS